MREVNSVATSVDEVFATPYFRNDHSMGNVGTDSAFGITLRTRRTQNQPDNSQPGSGMQGTTVRRIRYQVKLQTGRVERRMPTDSDQGGANHEGLSAVSEVSLPNPHEKKG